MFIPTIHIPPGEVNAPISDDKKNIIQDHEENTSNAEGK